MRARHGFRGGHRTGHLFLRSLIRTVNITSSVRANGEKCTLCKKCQIVCPTGAIYVDRKNSKWHIRPAKCVRCYRCISACPRNAVKII